MQRRDHSSAYIDLLRSYLMEVLGGSASLPPRRGRPAKPFYNFPVLSSAAAKAAPAHPVPGTQLDFAGGTNFRELGGYEADEGKHIKWGQIWRGIPTCKLTGEADRAKLDALGLRLILICAAAGKCRKNRTTYRTVHVWCRSAACAPRTATRSPLRRMISPP